MSAKQTFNRWSFLRAGLRHYWRSHLAVATGTAVAAAVLAGALIVGDSVRASLKAMTLDRLGDVDFAMSGPRFVREMLAQETSNNTGAEQPTMESAPAILLTGAVESNEGDSHRRAADVEVVACDGRLWKFLRHGDLEPPQENTVILSGRTADQLQAEIGDQVSLLVEIPQSIPRDALLGDREQTVAELLLTVSAIADESTGIARFGLNPSQQLPRNAFIHLRYAQQQLGVAETPRSRSNPMAKPARVNAIFFGGTDNADGIDPTVAGELTGMLNASVRLDDLHLRLVDHSDRGYVSLESEQMILDKALVSAANKTGKALHCRTTQLLAYLLNEIANAKDPAKHSMYSIAAGIDFPFFQKDVKDPLPTQGAMSADGVVINEWLAADLEAAVGDTLLVKYHQVGDRGELPEVEKTFRIAGIVPLAPPWDDQGLVPFVPGITDADTFREWRQPFPMKMSAITRRDEAYWDAHRATPKLFLDLATAQTLWQSRYGAATSVRMEGTTVSACEKQFLKELSPQITGLFVQPVKAQGLAAANGSTDFAGLFLGFSMFLIGSAAILIALLFRLNIERRMRELGLLAAVGWSPRTVRRQALLESLLVVLAGAAIGLPLAVGYAALMMYGLRTWWNAAVGTQFLFLSVDPGKLVAGGAAAVVIAMTSVILGLRSAKQLSPRSMLQGVIEVPRKKVAGQSSTRAMRVPLICASLAALLIVASFLGLIPSQEAFEGISWTAVSFFLSGSLALAAGMTAFSAILRHPPRDAAAGGMTLPRLCLRNAARNPRRSAMTSGLVAGAAFLVAAVASGRRNPAVELPDRNSGNGGFLLVGETSTPVLYDLNTQYGRAQLGIDAKDSKPWTDLRVVPFRVNPGENASCLNLYQAQMPTILAVPDATIREFAKDSRFKFIGMTPQAGWSALLNESDGPVPVLGDVNTLQYSLHKSPGDKLSLDEAASRQGRELEIAGMFDGSIFQGVLVMSESNFLKLYPERVGFQYFLIEAPQVASSQEAIATAESLSNMLETQLRDYGFDAERVAVRLADFLAVQNTYLSTFQTLGGLGLFLGVFGLFAVMLRNVLERRGELALMRAVGLENSRTAFVILGENLLLVGWGLAVGIGAALLAMAPHLASTGATPPWSGLLILTASMLIAGAIAAVLAFRDALAAPIVAALRND